ncbi:MAG TPA: cupredoxin domain-containing protein [Candidatus Paceibacterota bacterium]|nr:cupredoxin domain-containing protein [Candidatus Paceibacterota bacterium]
MSKSITTIVIIVLLVIIGITVFKKDAVDMAPNTPVTSENTPATGQPAPGTESGTSITGSLEVELGATTKTFTVTAKNFSFIPAQIKVKKGDTVKLTLENSEGMHDLKIDEFNAATKRIGSGQKETITFVASKTGSFEYYCSVGTHRQIGMVGKLIVE